MAKCAGISEKEFSGLNPKLKQWALPPSPKKQYVRVPNAKTFQKALKKIPKSKRLTYRRHKVKKGESLGRIANKYNISVASIQTANKIRNPNRIRVGSILIVPTGELSPQQIQKIKKSNNKKTTKRKRSSTHLVKKGDNLQKISKRYRVKTSDLMKWNNLLYQKRYKHRIFLKDRLVTGNHSLCPQVYPRHLHPQMIISLSERRNIMVIM